MRRGLPLLLLTALPLAYFGPLLYAAGYYPGGYDWSHTVVSNLANANDNPQAWRVAAGGIAVSGLLLALLGLEVRRALQPFAPRWTAWAGAFFILGGTLLTVSALIHPGHYALFGLAKAHAKIAQAASAVVALGMVLALPALLRLPRALAPVRAAAVVLVAGPITLFLVCWFVVPILESRASLAHREAFQHSVFASLAFWEWVGSVTVYAFLAFVLFAVPGKAPLAKEG